MRIQVSAVCVTSEIIVKILSSCCQQFEGRTKPKFVLVVVVTFAHETLLQIGGHGPSTTQVGKGAEPHRISKAVAHLFQNNQILSITETFLYYFYSL